MARFKCRGECMRNGVPYCEMLEEIEVIVEDPDTGETKTVKSYNCTLEMEEEY